mgnify:CR=1 FL=1
MSLLLTAHTLAGPVSHTLDVLAADGILDWMTAKNSQTQSLLKAMAVTVGVLFVIWQAIASRGAMARIIIAIIAAGVFVWGVFNVTTIKDRVGNEVNSAPTPTAAHQPERA